MDLLSMASVPGKDGDAGQAGMVIEKRGANQMET